MLCRVILAVRQGLSSARPASCQQVITTVIPEFFSNNCHLLPAAAGAGAAANARAGHKYMEFTDYLHKWVNSVI
jgi:hypothetical protein